MGRWRADRRGVRLRSGRSPGGHLVALPAAATFVNDVVMTGGGVFTDSFDDVLYKIPIGRDRSLGRPESVPLTGSCQNAAGFKINGIDATAGTVADRRA